MGHCFAKQNSVVSIVNINNGKKNDEYRSIKKGEAKLSPQTTVDQGRDISKKKQKNKKKSLKKVKNL